MCQSREVCAGDLCAARDSSNTSWCTCLEFSPTELSTWNPVTCPCSNGGDLEEGGNHDPGNNGSFWDLMTFKFISPVMNQGVLKQLDSDDLLPLLPDMSPSFFHDVILSSWREQLSNNGSNPSLLRALCNAYGWQYLCLGLLKFNGSELAEAQAILAAGLQEAKTLSLIAEVSEDKMSSKRKNINNPECDAAGVTNLSPRRRLSDNCNPTHYFEIKED